MMAPIPCSRTPYRTYRPAYEPRLVLGGWKSSADFHRVKLDPVKSADCIAQTTPGGVSILAKDGHVISTCGELTGR
jgi:hypothetical protein